MKKNKKLYEGKGKKIYLTDEPDQLIQEFKDDIASSEDAKKGSIKNKGSVNTQISSHLFRYLESYHIPTHYIKKVADTQMLVRKLDIIPIEVVVHNLHEEKTSKKGKGEVQELEQPNIEYFLKDEEREDPVISEDDVVSFGHATEDEIMRIRRFAVKSNAVLKAFFKRRGLQLMDIKLEFGRYKDKILLADEISLDTCRFWDAAAGEIVDSDRMCKDLARAEVQYQELSQRILSY